MSTVKKSQNVNWQAGMKATTEHYALLDNFVRDSIRESSSIFINSFNYGILPDINGPSELKIKCDLISNDQQIKVVVVSCHAITAGGIIIDRKDEDNMVPGINLIDCIYDLDKAVNDPIDIVISADILTKVPIGDPDPNESLPRRPFMIPKSSLKLLTADSPINQINELKVGEIIFEEGIPKVSAIYVPPCAQINSLVALQEIHERYVKVQNDGQIACTFLVRQMRSGKSPVEEIAYQILRLLGEQLVTFYIDNSDDFIRIIPFQSPYLMVNYFIKLARMVRMTVNCFDDNIKHIMFNYFKDWSQEFEPGDFEKAITELIVIKYDHNDLGNIFRQIDKFLNPLARLFQVIPKLPFDDLNIPDIVDITPLHDGTQTDNF